MRRGLDRAAGGATLWHGERAEKMRSVTIERLSLAAVLLLIASCSGSVTTLENDADPSEDSDAGGSGATGGTSGDGTGGNSEEEEPYVEPDCPDEPPPPVNQQCDPLDPLWGCEEGYGCYPYLSYPYGEGCGHASFGALCMPASTGEHGAFCGDEDGYCAPGYLCVVGAAGGKRCGKICEPVARHDCPDGLICGETDIQGYGVCF